MLNVKLVNRNDIAQYKQISKTVYDDVLNAIILETQIQDIAELLGENLFNDVLENPSNYSDLLNGGAYTHNSITYTNYGLKAVICYYVYARYMMFGSVIDTPFSAIEKLEGAESRPISDKTKKDLYQLNRDSAFAIWKSVQNYLVRTDNALYKDCYCERPKSSSFNISKIV